FRMGAITAGLNHVRHYYETRYRIDGYLQQKGFDPEGKISSYHRTEKGITSFINKITPLGFDYVNAGESTIIVSNEKNGTIGPNSFAYYQSATHDITVFQQLFSTNYRFFALILGHEIQHALYHYSGIYNNWAKNNSDIWAYRETEVRAYQWQIDYSSNTIRAPWNGPYSVYSFYSGQNKYKSLQKLGK
ncbi:MAG: hypothetical protein ACR2MS_06850, partial [Weeksellaceae bacterium]